MRMFRTVLTLASLLPVLSYCSEPPVPEGRRLRTIVAEKYPDGNVYVGGTTGWTKRARGSGIVMDREFNYVTPENDFKHSVINPEPGVWAWEKADAWVKHCAEQGQVIRMHGPIGPQVSKWAREDSRTAEELEASMTEFLIKSCQRYDKHPHIKWMDVVNETITAGGRWMMPKGGSDHWENPWPKMGFDETDPLKPPKYIKLAFETCAKHAPNTKLVLNQHGDMQEPMWEKVKLLVKYLRSQGCRVDGIGWQAHVNVGFENEGNNMNALSELIDWTHANGMSFHVTENNVWLRGKVKDYEAQAKTFGAILEVLLEKRHTGVVTWNVWNLSDGDAWSVVKDQEGSIFCPDFRPKPAYYALQAALENPPAPRKGYRANVE